MAILHPTQQPVFKITISNVGLNTVSPSDGFIDPISVEQYRFAVPYIGNIDTPNVIDGDSVNINDFPITFSAGNLASIVSQINASTGLHHMIASIGSGGKKLVLVAEPLSSEIIPTITGQSMDKLGWGNRVKGVIPDLPNSLLISRAKERANLRWKLILQQITITNVIDTVSDIVSDGNLTTAPTSISFNIQTGHNYYDYDINGNLIYGSYAIKNAVARALINDYSENCSIWDPTKINQDPPTGTITERVLAGKLADTLNIALSAITVITLN